MEKVANEKGKKKASRKTFLKGAGGVLVLVAGGGVWRAADQGVFDPKAGPAFEPWKDWQSGKGPLALVAAAILAANAHNTQPWIFRVSDSRIDLFADRSRDIGTIDPFSREMYIGLGCSLENLLLAARANGYEYDLALLPDRSDPTHAARINLSAGSKDLSVLYRAIPKRHTNRYAYDTSRRILGGTLDALGALNDDLEVKVLWFTTDAERKKVGTLLVEATRAIAADPQQGYDNGGKWVRVDRDDIQRRRDGLTPDAMGLSPLTLLAAKMLPAPDTSKKSSGKDSGGVGLATEKRQAHSASTFGIFAIRDYDDDSQRMRAGRLWQRMHLWITSKGLAAQPMNQLHERADREVQLGIEPRFGDALKDIVGDPSWRGTFTFRLGYPTEQARPSPRRSVKDVLG